MALFGRESDADRRRAERVRAWVQARSPYALVSGLLGILAVVDFVTPLAWALGPAAVVIGGLGLRDVGRRPQYVGRRLCYLGILLGALGLTANLVIRSFVR